MTDITVEELDEAERTAHNAYLKKAVAAARRGLEFKLKRDSEFFGSVASSLEPTSEDEEIDTSDAPEVLDWSGARRGLFYRPSDIAGVKERLALGRHCCHSALRVIEGLELEIEGYRNVNWKHLYKQARAEIDSLKSDNEWIIRVEAEQTEKLKDAQAEIERLKTELMCWKFNTREQRQRAEEWSKLVDDVEAITAERDELATNNQRLQEIANSYSAERDRLREALAKIADGSTAYSSSWQRDLARAALGESDSKITAVSEAGWTLEQFRGCPRCQQLENERDEWRAKASLASQSENG